VKLFFGTYAFIQVPHHFRESDMSPGRIQERKHFPARPKQGAVFPDMVAFVYSAAILFRIPEFLFIIVFFEVGGCKEDSGILAVDLFGRIARTCWAPVFQVFTKPRLSVVNTA
jgi:hypothetical protein